MYKHLPPVILASQSPRRAQLLRSLGLAFTVHPAMVAEDQIAAQFPLYEQAEQLARAKALATKQHLEVMAQRALIIAADTVVMLDGERRDKPRDLEAARTMLTQLSGRSHEVITGVALAQNECIHTFCERTIVHFATLSIAEIDHYVRLGLPLDKAGGYGIQDWIGLACVERIEGSYTNVMGLPTQAVHRALMAWSDAS